MFKKALNYFNGFLRNKKFLYAVIVTVLFVILSMIPDYLPFHIFTSDTSRPVMNSLWTSILMSAIINLVLIFFWFFFIRNYPELKQEKNSIFIKFISKLLILTFLSLIVIITAGIMFFPVSDIKTLIFPELLTQWFIISFPFIIFISSLSAFLESTEKLKGITGIIIFIAVFLGVFMLSVLSIINKNFFIDFSGFAHISKFMNYDINIFGNGILKETYLIDKISYENSFIYGRFFMALISIILLFTGNFLHRKSN